MESSSSVEQQMSPCPPFDVRPFKSDPPHRLAEVGYGRFAYLRKVGTIETKPAHYDLMKRDTPEGFDVRRVFHGRQEIGQWHWEEVEDEWS